jgi:hypothetical protein
LTKGAFESEDGHRSRAISPKECLSQTNITMRPGI